MRSMKSTLWSVIGSRRWVNRQVERVAETVHDARILELGSGRRDLGADTYSMRSFFDPSNEFVQSDVVPEYGHAIVDATTMDFDGEFDVILCSSVLEHVYDARAAVDRIHRALKPGGRAVISVPHLFPYHDEPEDFWRFTEHSVRRMLAEFADVDVKHRGPRRFPFTLFIVATK